MYGDGGQFFLQPVNNGYGASDLGRYMGWRARAPWAHGAHGVYGPHGIAGGHPGQSGSQAHPNMSHAQWLKTRVVKKGKQIAQAQAQEVADAAIPGEELVEQMATDLIEQADEMADEVYAATATDRLSLEDYYEENKRLVWVAGAVLAFLLLRR